MHYARCTISRPVFVPCLPAHALSRKYSLDRADSQPVKMMSFYRLSALTLAAIGAVSARDILSCGGKDPCIAILSLCSVNCIWVARLLLCNFQRCCAFAGHYEPCCGGADGTCLTGFACNENSQCAPCGDEWQSCCGGGACLDGKSCEDHQDYPAGRCEPIICGGTYFGCRSSVVLIDTCSTCSCGFASTLDTA